METQSEVQHKCRLDYHKEYYQRTKHKYKEKVFCEVCQKEMEKWSIKRHNNTFKHKYNLLNNQA